MSTHITENEDGTVTVYDWEGKPCYTYNVDKMRVLDHETGETHPFEWGEGPTNPDRT